MLERTICVRDARLVVGVKFLIIIDNIGIIFEL